jgi:hypothetical protein
MAAPIYLLLYSDGKLYFSSDNDWLAGSTTKTGTGTSSGKKSTEAGTLVKVWKINPQATPQLITTMTGSGNASASALAASGGSATLDDSKLTELT